MRAAKRTGTSTARRTGTDEETAHINGRHTKDGAQCEPKGWQGIVVYDDLLAALREQKTRRWRRGWDQIAQNEMAQMRLSELIGMRGVS